MNSANRKLGSKLRAAGYLLGAILAIMVTAWSESLIWLDVKRLESRAELIGSEIFHRSEDLEVQVRALNIEVLRYSLQRSPQRLDFINTNSTELRRWLVSQRADLKTQERALWDEIETLYAQYLAHVGLLLQTNVADASLPAWRTQKEEIVGQLLGRAKDLDRLEKAGLSQFRQETRDSMRILFRKLLVSSLVLVAMGGVIAFLGYRGIIAPLRERLSQTEAVIERQEKLSSLGVLAAGVAHEIRNPLTSIKARLFTQQSLLEGNSEALEDNVFITGEISRLQQIVADFLAFARPAEPQKVTLKATQPFRDLEGLFRPALTKANIELKMEYLADPRIEADPAQLKQVLINLVQNAAESIGRDGVITLRTRTQKRNRVTHPTTVAVLEVEDSGKGIPPEVHKRLFDPFFTTKASGTGLGLSIAARILEKHGGTLEYQSAQTRGAIFRLTLPIATTDT